MIWTDSTFIGYCCNTIISLYGFILFSWGCLIAKRQQWTISFVYLYVMGLLGGIAWDQFLSAWSRYLTITNDPTQMIFRMTYCWKSRPWIIFIMICAIVGHMSYRAFITKFKGE